MCETLLGELEPLVRRRFRISVRDVDDDPEWRSTYGDRVPVVCFDGQEICAYQLDRQAVSELLASSDR